MDRIQESAANRAMLEDWGLQDWIRTRHLEPRKPSLTTEEVMQYLEYVGGEEIMHTLEEALWVLHDLTLILHAAPRYDLVEELNLSDEDAEMLACRTCGSVTRCMSIDKAVRRVLTQSGHLRTVPLFHMDTGQPWGRGKIITTEGYKTARKLADSDRHLGDIDDLDTVNKCLEDARKMSTHLMAILYEDVQAHVERLTKPYDIAEMLGAPRILWPIVSGVLSTLAEWRVIVKSSGRYRRGVYTRVAMPWTPQEQARFEHV